MSTIQVTPVALGDGADVLLRFHRACDLDGVVEQCQDEEMRQCTTIPVPYARADAEWFLDHVAQGWIGTVLPTDTRPYPVPRAGAGGPVTPRWGSTMRLSAAPRQVRVRKQAVASPAVTVI